MARTLKALKRVTPPPWGFGDRLRLIRRHLKLTQAETAARLEVGLPAYAAWEAGQSKPADLTVMAVRLETVLGVDRAWWLGWADMDGPGATVKITSRYSSLPQAA